MQNAPSSVELRAWARSNGFIIADTGRISAVVVQAWQAAHHRPDIPSPRIANPAKARSERTPLPTIPAPRAAPPSAPSAATRDSRGFGRTAARLRELEERMIAAEARITAVEESESKKSKPVFRRET